VRFYINAGNKNTIDPYSRDTFRMDLHANEVIDLDGRVTLFWNLKRNSHYYFYDGGQTGMPSIFNLILKAEVTRYTQYYSYENPTEARRLSSTEVSVTKKQEKEEDNSNIIFQFFYVLSQLGGLYSFLACVLGIVLSPLIHNMFSKDLVYTMRSVSKI